MSSGSLPKPMMFADAVGRVSMELPHNQATADLAYDYKAQSMVGDVLAGWGQRRFVPLISVYSSSQISLPLYAGDGLVAKVTPARFENTTPKPFALPAIRSKTIESDYVQYHVQLFPFVTTGNISAEEVEAMRRQLDEVGYRFANGDDRPDNLGRRPGGELVVLDHGATEPKPGHRPRLGEAEAWVNKIHALYGTLYQPDGVKPQRDTTSFVKRPALSTMTLHKNFNALQSSGKTPAADNTNRPPIWKQVLGLGR